MARKKDDDVFSVAEELRAGVLPSAEKLAQIQESYRCYSTGSFSLDLAIGERDPITGLPGIPERAIVEMFGAPMSLKSATAEHLMKSVLDADPNNYIGVVYAEEPDMDRVKAMGLDRSRIVAMSVYDDDKVQNQMAEQHLDQCKRMVRDPSVKLIVIDSLKALCSVRQLFDEKGEERDLDDSEQLGLRAKLVGTFIRDFKQLNRRAILFMTNQISDKIRTGPWDMSPNPQFNIGTPAGRAKEFEAHLRIENRTSPIWSDEKHPHSGQKMVEGWEVTYRLVKNKFSKSTANRVAVSEFFLNPPGFRREKEVLSMAKYLGVIEVSGAFYTLGEQKVRGEANAVEYLIKNPKVREKLELEIIPRADEFFALGTSNQMSIASEV